MTVDAYRKAAERVTQRGYGLIAGEGIGPWYGLDDMGDQLTWSARRLNPHIEVEANTPEEIATLMHGIDLMLAIIDAEPTCTYLTGAAATPDGVPASVHASMARQSAERALAAKTQEAGS